MGRGTMNFQPFEIFLSLISPKITLVTSLKKTVLMFYSIIIIIWQRNIDI